MAAHKLVIHPVGGLPEDGLVGEIETRLAEIGLIGDPFQLDGAAHFLAGPRFLELVSLVGCSPYLELDPPAEPAEFEAAARAGRFCHIGLRLETRPRLRADGRARPRCPDCGRSASASQVLAAGAAASCGDCGTRQPAEAWNWREAGGFSNFFIEIWSIYRSEGIPLPPLMQTLAEVTGGEWRHFYIAD